MWGALHAVRKAWPAASGWDEEESEENTNDEESATTEVDHSIRGTAIDAHNGFNELSQYEMLLRVAENWAKASRFAFNCYHHFLLVFFVDPGCAIIVILGKEGICQGCTHGLKIYAVTLLPLVRFMQEKVRGCTKPWYDDDCAVVGQPVQKAAVISIVKKVGPAFSF